MNPDINRGGWSDEEDLLLLKSYIKLGKKWSDISRIMNNRTENAVKNRWKSLIRKFEIEFGSSVK